jgi:nucleotidyltransferase/DNA polymerase involved in DNA repair
MNLKTPLTDEPVISTEEIAMARMIIEKAAEDGITEITDQNVTTIVMSLREVLKKRGHTMKPRPRN